MNARDFGQVGPALQTAGYQPIPIKYGDKVPAVESWQHPRPAPDYLPACARCGVGILTRLNPSCDIDVRHVEIVQEMHALAEQRLGPGRCWRVGFSPKRLIPYRTSAPFPKVTTAGYRFSGDEPGAKPHKVEILAGGQQFVAYGIHPDTQKPYTWPDEDLLSVHSDELTEIDASRAHAFITEADVLLAKIGKVAEPANRPGRPTGPWEAGKAGRPVRNLREARDVLAALRRIPNSDLPYDDWLRVAYGLKAALGEERGKQVFLAWSAQSSKDVPIVSEHRWKTIKPTKAGWRYLVRLAGGSE
jgi:hypothetical protein